MKFQFLPHYFKYIGLFLYFVLGVLPFANDFVAGFAAGYEAGSGREIDSPDYLFGLPDYLFSKTFQIIHLLGVLLYAMAKDKVFDEFMLKLRMESLYIVFFVTLIFILFRIAILMAYISSAVGGSSLILDKI